MKTIQLSATGLGLLSVLLLINCHPWQWEELPRVDPDCPVVESLSPTGAPFGDTVTVFGSGFDANNLSQFILTINDIEIPILDMKDSTSLRFQVPRGIGSGVVKVSRAGNKCSAQGSEESFLYLPTATSAEVFAGQISNTGCPTCFSSPQGMDVDAEGNVYVADRSHHVIKKISNIGGTISVTRIAGIENTSGYVNDPNSLFARFKSPGDVALDEQGNIYVADETNRCIRKVTKTSATSYAVSLFSGDTSSLNGDEDNTTLLLARYTRPVGVALGEGGKLFVTEYSRNRLRMLDFSTPAGFVTTILGNSNGTTDDLNAPVGVTFSKARDDEHPIIVADRGGRLVKSVNVNKAIVNIPLAAAAIFIAPNDMVVDDDGVVYVVDRGGAKQIFAVYPDNSYKAIAGAGLLYTFESPSGIAIDRKNKVLYVSDESLQVVVRINIE